MCFSVGLQVGPKYDTKLKILGEGRIVFLLVCLGWVSNFCSNPLSVDFQGPVFCASRLWCHEHRKLAVLCPPSDWCGFVVIPERGM